MYNFRVEKQSQKPMRDVVNEVETTIKELVGRLFMADFDRNIAETAEMLTL